MKKLTGIVCLLALMLTLTACAGAGDWKYEDLPENCRKYVEFIEEQIGYPVTMVSNGPGREDIIYRESPLKK